MGPAPSPHTLQPGEPARAQNAPRLPTTRASLRGLTRGNAAPPGGPCCGAQSREHTAHDPGEEGRKGPGSGGRGAWTRGAASARPPGRLPAALRDALRAAGAASSPRRPWGPRGCAPRVAVRPARRSGCGQRETPLSCAPPVCGSGVRQGWGSAQDAGRTRCGVVGGADTEGRRLRGQGAAPRAREREGSVLLWGGWGEALLLGK